jgi:hypothetical protein
MSLFNFFPKFQNQGGLLGTIGVTTTLDQAFGFLGSITGTGYNRPGDGSTQPTQQNNTLIYAGIAFAALIVVVLFVVLMNKK